jgi:hypothetical protein
MKNIGDPAVGRKFYNENISNITIALIHPGIPCMTDLVPLGSG